jgi:hypothetical protein
MDGMGSGLCPIVGFDMDDAENFSVATARLIVHCISHTQRKDNLRVCCTVVRERSYQYICPYCLLFLLVLVVADVINI